MKNYAVLLASGTGERLENPLPKQFLKVAGRTLVEHTLEIFERHSRIDGIIIVVHRDYRSLMEEILLKNHFTKVIKLINGGKSRQESSFFGVNSLPEGEECLVLLHAAVRPFLSTKTIDLCLDALGEYGAVDVAIPATDTIIKRDERGFIDSIPSRRELMRGQTPQGFRASIIKEAHRRAQAENFTEVTDDCGLVLRYGISPIFIVQGEESNLKVTYPGDIVLADKLFQIRSIRAPLEENLKGFEGKVLVCFGAGKGIGREVVQRAEGLGARVYGTSLSTGTDVCDYQSVRGFLEGVLLQEGRIDFVVNTAGLLGMGKVADREIETMRREIEVNYLGALNVLKASVAPLRASRGSLVLFTSSSYTRGRALYSVYSSCKAAVVNLMQGAAEELLGDGVRVNAINPERTATPMRRENFGLEDPRTLLDPREVAEATLQTLLSPLTGQVVDVKRGERVGEP